MAKCNFTIPFTVPAAGSDHHRPQGGHCRRRYLHRDTYSGSVDVSRAGFEIQASYTISHSEIHFSITKKPLFITCHRIEEEVKKYMAPSPPVA